MNLFYTEPEHDAEACLRALTFDNLTAEQFDNTWKACSKFRFNDIKKMGDTAAIIEKWPFYKIPTGFRLVGFVYFIFVMCFVMC